MIGFLQSRVFRCLVHMPVGLICALLCATGYMPIGVIFFLGFVLYELNEDWHIKDSAWKDLFGFLVGLPIIPLVVILSRLLK